VENPLSNDLVVIRKFGLEYEAQIAQAVLDAHEIPSTILRDNAGGMIPALQLLFEIRLAVRREDVAEATRVLDAPATTSSTERP
jgi:hypothetical protein